MDLARSESRTSDTRVSRSHGRTDRRIAIEIGLGGKDLYRQARAVWNAAREGDPRALASVRELDQGMKSIFAAYKDLRRRDRFAADFKPTPYDVWSFRRNPGFGVPHPGAIPAGLLANLLHYFTQPGALVVDPMAGGGILLDVCQAMGRRCLAYDKDPIRDDVRKWDVNFGLPDDAMGCDLVFWDPPYHAMRAGKFAQDPGIAELSFDEWLRFLKKLAIDSFLVLKESGYVALLLAGQSEKCLPVGYEYLDHAFFGYEAMRAAGFVPVRRISCPMSGAYLPQQVRRARAEGRLLGQVRDLLVMRKPALHSTGSPPASS